MKLGEMIKHYRDTQSNMSQRQFALKCGLSNGCISMFERGINPNTQQPIIPTLPALQKVARGMEMTLDEMFQQLDDDQLIMLKGNTPSLTPREKNVIDAFRAQPDMQPVVERILGIENRE